MHIKMIVTGVAIFAVAFFATLQYGEPSPTVIITDFRVLTSNPHAHIGNLFRCEIAMRNPTALGTLEVSTGDPMLPIGTSAAVVMCRMFEGATDLAVIPTKTWIAPNRVQQFNSVHIGDIVLLRVLPTATSTAAGVTFFMLD